MGAATAFHRALGFARIVDPPHYARFECRDGDSRFPLALNQGAFDNGAISCFEIDRLDDWAAELVQQGIDFEHMPTDMRYLWREAVVSGPVGNRTKRDRAGRNRRRPPPGGSTASPADRAS